MATLRSLVPGMGLVTVLVPPCGFPALRLLKHHAPTLKIDCLDSTGKSVCVSLENLDISQEGVLGTNKAEQVNIDRAQLAKLGG